MKLSRFDIASIKRIADCVAQNRKKLAKVDEKLEALYTKKQELLSEINEFESPILSKWGFDSKQLIEANFDLDLLTERQNSTEPRYSEGMTQVNSDEESNVTESEYNE